MISDKPEFFGADEAESFTESYGVIKHGFDLRLMADAFITPFLVWYDSFPVPDIGTFFDSKAWQIDWRPSMVCPKLNYCESVLAIFLKVVKTSDCLVDPLILKSFSGLVDRVVIQVDNQPVGAYSSPCTGQYLGFTTPLKWVLLRYHSAGMGSRSIDDIRAQLYLTFIHELVHAIQRSLGVPAPLPFGWYYRRFYPLVAIEIEAYVEEARAMSEVRGISVERALLTLFRRVVSCMDRRWVPVDPSVTTRKVADTWFSWWLDNYVGEGDRRHHELVWEAMNQVPVAMVSYKARDRGLMPMPVIENAGDDVHSPQVTTVVDGEMRGEIPRRK